MKRIYKFNFIIVLVFTFISFSSCAKKIDLTQVKIKNQQILVNGKPYFIKGICYNPVPKGSNEVSFDNLTQDLALMKEAGINTIRVYVPIDDSKILDQINAAGIKIIMDFGYNQHGYYDILSGSFINYIKKYKNYPAILFWELGNEYNYHPEWFNGDIKNWYKALSNAAELVHKTDKFHPVATAHGELPTSKEVASCSNVDIWGMNVYRWDNPESIIPQWKKVSSKPMYFSEAGTDSYMTISKDGYVKGKNEKAQAAATKNILNAIFKNKQNCLGVTLFEFSDELWKAGNNKQLDPGGWAPNSSGVPYDGTPNEEYWGIVTVDRTKKQVFNIVKEIYSE